MKLQSFNYSRCMNKWNFPSDNRTSRKNLRTVSREKHAGNRRKREMNRLEVGKIAKTVVYWQPIRIFTLHYRNRRFCGLLPVSRLPCVLDEFPGKASRSILSWECVQRTPSRNATNQRKFCFNEGGIVCICSNKRDEIVF